MTSATDAPAILPGGDVISRLGNWCLNQGPAVAILFGICAWLWFQAPVIVQGVVQDVINKTSRERMAVPTPINNPSNQAQGASGFESPAGADPISGCTFVATSHCAFAPAPAGSHFEVNHA